MNKKSIISIATLTSLVLVTSVLVYNVYMSKNGTFTGTISGVEDCYTFIGSSSCTWIIDGKKVSWAWGSSLGNQTGGEVEGLSRGKEDVGEHVEVKAEFIKPNEFSINKPGYYIRKK